MKRREFLRISTAAVPAASALAGASASAAQNTRGESGGGSPAERFTSLSRDFQKSLNGDWHFKEDPKEVGEQEEWHHPRLCQGPRRPRSASLAIGFRRSARLFRDGLVRTKLPPIR